PDGGSLDATLPDGGLILGGVGVPCDSASPLCRPGLACTGGTCQPGHSTAVGGDCEISAECTTGNYCAAQKCAPAGTGDANAACQSDADCKSGLRCNIVGLNTACQPEGTKDVGDDCQTSNDCFGGLTCAANKCTPTPQGAPLGGLPWTGVDCP